MTLCREQVGPLPWSGHVEAGLSRPCTRAEGRGEAGLPHGLGATGALLPAVLVVVVPALLGPPCSLPHTRTPMTAAERERKREGVREEGSQEPRSTQRDPPPWARLRFFDILAYWATARARSPLRAAVPLTPSAPGSGRGHSHWARPAWPPRGPRRRQHTR